MVKIQKNEHIEDELFLLLLQLKFSIILEKKRKILEKKRIFHFFLQ